MKGLCLLVPLLFLTVVFIQEARADTHTAASCSSPDIQSAIDSASDGDTVAVPACDETIWTGSVTIPSSKGITLQGAGTIDSNGNENGAKTILNIGTNILLVNTDTGHPQTRITGIHFVHSIVGGTSVGAITMAGYTGGLNYATYPGSHNWRVEHNYFEYTETGAQSSPGVAVVGWTWGVIDHNVFYHQGRALFVVMGNDLEDPYPAQPYCGTHSWDTDKGGQIDWGGPNAVYIENNWGIGKPEEYLNPDQFMDANCGARIVLRYNNIKDMYVMTHHGGNWARGTIHTELYNNAFSSTVYDGYGVLLEAVFLRSGSFVAFGNTFSGTFRLTKLLADDPGVCSPSGYYAGGCTAWPCADQIGMGPDATASGLTPEPAYAWDNDGEEFGYGGCQGYVLIGRDVIHSVKPGYSAYTYPHPLQNGIIPPPTCPDGACSSGETCAADRCCNGASYTSAQKCCSGIVYTGTCCSSSDCSSGYTCSSHVCVQSTQTCSQLGGTDCCISGESCLGTSYSGASDCSGTCCSQACTAGSKTITVDSTYSGYSTAPIDDGAVNASGGKSTTWASAESLTDPHWITISFPSPVQISYANLWWAYNSLQQRLMTSQQVQVQYLDSSSYITAATLPYSGDVANSSVTFTPVTTSSIRFYQLAGMGPSSYPEIFWITEADYGHSCHKSDTDCSGCISQPELMAFISRWYVNNQDVTIAELMEAIGLWKRGC